MARKGGTARSLKICPVCGDRIVDLSNHVRKHHATTITDLQVSGRIKNESYRA